MMTYAEHEAKIADFVTQYNAAMQEERVDKRKLDSIEEQMKAATAEAKKDMKTIAYGRLLKAKNPMLEACRVHSFTHPAYALEKEKGIVVGAKTIEKTLAISPVELGNEIIKAAQTKNCPYDQNGVVEHSHVWEYRTEKLAYMLTYRTLKNLGCSPESIEEFRHCYAIRDLAAREKMGETPTSNKQLVKLVQSIVDQLVFMPDENGLNAIKVINKDVEFLLSMFEKAGRGVGQVEVLKGNKVKDYIFAMCHMIVTGKAYEVRYNRKKESTSTAAEPQRPVIIRKAVKETASEPKKAKADKKSVKVSDSETVKVQRPKKAAAPAAPESDELPSLDEVFPAETAVA